MCGIVGEISGIHEFREGSILAKCDLLRHRGPDSQGTYACEIEGKGGRYKIALGHRRLKVLDLSSRAAGPMPNDDGTIWITYNGEIYNFREIRSELQSGGWKFRTESDTEVLLKAYEAWGIECLGMLNGMFAFGIWDGRLKRLFLARDQVGIKPLYFECRRKGLIFASELKAVRSFSDTSHEVDPVSLAEYLALGYVPGPRTIFKDVLKLQPAHYLVWCDGELAIRRYWKPSDYIRRHSEGGKLRDGGNQPLESRELTTRLFELLRASIRRQLVSDVPLGAFLSGGLDSSLIVALMSKVTDRPIKTFSVGFRGRGYYDERVHARQIAELFGTDHREFEVEPRAVDDLPRLVQYFDEPFADSSAIPLFHLAREARQYVTVTLSGTGGDDLFGGYRRYMAHRVQRLYDRIPKFMRENLAAVARHLPATRKTKLGEYILFLRRLTCCDSQGAYQSYLNLMTVINPSLMAEVMQDPWIPSGAPGAGEGPFADSPYPEDTVNSLLYRDFHTYLPDDLLVKEDRMTMAHGLESRVPFLDRDLVEFAWRIPGNLKVKGWTTKYVLKKAAERVLPLEIVHRTKHGFAVPLAEWFRSGLREMAYDLLRSSNSGYLRPGGGERLLDAHQSGKVDYSPQLWALLVLRVWEEQSKEPAGSRALLQ